MKFTPVLLFRTLCLCSPLDFLVLVNKLSSEPFVSAMMLLLRDLSVLCLKVQLWLCCFQQAPESLLLSFVHLPLIAISVFTASVLPLSPFHSTEPEQLFLLALLWIQPGVFLGYYLWMSFLK